jgi:hypothetical protein
MAMQVQTSGSGLPPIDRAIIWPASIPIVAALVVSTAYSFDTLSLLAICLGALTICGWVIGIVLASGLAVWRRAWRRLASLAAMLICAGPAMGASMIAGDYIHLLLGLPYYSAKIAEAATDPKAIYFHWPSAGLIPSYERNLVYDPSDEQAADVGKNKPLEAEPAVRKTVRHLAGHFYLVELSW